MSKSGEMPVGAKVEDSVSSIKQDKTATPQASDHAVQKSNFVKHDGFVTVEYGSSTILDDQMSKQKLLTVAAFVLAEVIKAKNMNWVAAYFNHSETKVAEAKDPRYHKIPNILYKHFGDLVQDFNEIHTEDLKILATAVKKRVPGGNTLFKDLQAITMVEESATADDPSHAGMMYTLSRMMYTFHAIVSSDFIPDLDKLEDTHLKEYVKFIKHHFQQIWDGVFTKPMISFSDSAILKNRIIDLTREDNQLQADDQAFGYAATIEPITIEKADAMHWDSVYRNCATIKWHDIDETDHLSRGIAQLAYAGGPFAPTDYELIRNPTMTADGQSSLCVAEALPVTIRGKQDTRKLQSATDPNYVPLSLRSDFGAVGTEANVIFDAHIASRKLEKHMGSKHLAPLAKVTLAMAISTAFVLKSSDLPLLTLPFTDFASHHGIKALQDAILEGAKNPTLMKHYEDKGFNVEEFGKSTKGYYDGMWDEVAMDIFAVFCERYGLHLKLGIHQAADKTNPATSTFPHVLEASNIAWIHHQTIDKADDKNNFCGKWYGFDDQPEKPRRDTKKAGGKGRSNKNGSAEAKA